MPGASLFGPLNALYGGRLCEHLEDWRAAGLTLDAIQERIATEKGWSPGRETIRRWLDTGECS